MYMVNASFVLPIWSRIINELAFQQDAAPREFKGSVVNPIIGKPCILDTACSAKVFAVEYKCSKEQEWLQRASFALDAIGVPDWESGLPEPVWDVLGWHDLPASLVATERIFSAVYETKILLGQDISKNTFEQLLAYLRSCFQGRGIFSHHPLQEKRQCGQPENATAIALYLLESIALHSTFSRYPLLQQRANAVNHLIQGQHKDGYWPYSLPGMREVFIRKFSFLRHIRYLNKLMHYEVFGDFVHHCMVCYYLTKYYSFSQNKRIREGIEKGWSWVYKHLIGNGELCIDWDWEPVANSPRYSNFRDTNSYFVILGMIPYLYRCRIVGPDIFVIAERLLKHIRDNLLAAEAVNPCIVPHEGPSHILRNILPCVEESSAWKGFLLSDFILALLDK